MEKALVKPFLFQFGQLEYGFALVYFLYLFKKLLHGTLFMI